MVFSRSKLFFPMADFFCSWCLLTAGWTFWVIFVPKPFCFRSRPINFFFRLIFSLRNFICFWMVGGQSLTRTLIFFPDICSWTSSFSNSSTCCCADCNCSIFLLLLYSLLNTNTCGGEGRSYSVSDPISCSVSWCGDSLLESPLDPTLVS